jgi:uncharacterized protein YbjT (DUF2867 family)
MVETILVTGATGTVGSEVVNQLSNVKSDFKIKAAVRSVENAKKVKGDGIEVIQADYNKPETLRETFRDIDRLFIVPPETPNAIEQASNVIDEVKKSEIKHVVKLSALGADVESIVSSLRLHRQTEKIIEEAGIPFTFLRPAEFMQNFVNWYGPTIRSNNAFYLPAGNPKVSFVDVRDIAAVAVKVLTDDGNGRHKGKVYTITGPEILSYHQAAEILSKATGKKIRYINVPEEEYRQEMKDSGIGDWWINVIMEVYQFYKSRIQEQISTAVEEVTGKKPITFAQFARDYSVFR